METITYRGKVGRVFFCNFEGAFMAGVLELDEHDAERGSEIRFAGKIAARQGDRIEVTGAWGEHPKFGAQFQVETGVAKMDESPEALAHLLAKHEDFKGLGTARARKVVEAALSVSDDGEVSSALVKYPAEIAERSGVKLEIVQRASEIWGERRGYFEALGRLSEQGWTPNQAAKIVESLGENAAAMVAGDPYMLVGRLSRFGFRTVDAIAQGLGFPKSDPRRLAAGLAYCLDEIAQGGDTYTTRTGLTAKALDILRPDTLESERLIGELLDGMIGSGTVTLATSPNGNEIVADTRLAKIEVEVFCRLLEGLSDDAVEPLGLTGPRTVEGVATLNEGQAAAHRGFSTRRFSLIAGGAGKGKTYLMDKVCETASENRLRIALCAPTGKAARKLAHATKRRASTIHRLLRPEYDEETGGFVFTKGPHDPLEEDLVIVDEVSMVDVRLMLSLLRALRPSARLLLVGDHNQIPSVGPGAILRDLLAAQSRYPESVHVLTETVRQAGTLARNTTAILDGIVVGEECPAWGFQKTERGSENGAAAMAAVLVESIVTAPQPLEPWGRHLDMVWDVQVLSPMRRGELGTYALNVHLQRLRQRLLGNPDPEETPKDRPPKPLVGDRVIWTENDRELDLDNGTQALVVAFPKGGAMELYTEDGREVTVPAGKRNRVEVAWAMTIHKAQGSEWPFVLLVASTLHSFMHDRNLLYTGASRAAEALTILGDAGGIRAFANERKSERRKTLGSFLVHGWETPPPLAQDVGALVEENTSGQLAR